MYASVHVLTCSRHEDGLSCQHGVKPPLTYLLPHYMYVHVCRCIIYYNAVADPGGFRRLKSLPPPQADSKFKIFWECSAPTVHFTWSNIYLASPVQNPGSFPDNVCEGVSLPGYMIIRESPRPVGWLGP